MENKMNSFIQYIYVIYIYKIHILILNTITYIERNQMKIYLISMIQNCSTVVISMYVKMRKRTFMLLVLLHNVRSLVFSLGLHTGQLAFGLH